MATRDVGVPPMGCWQWPSAQHGEGLGPAGIFGFVLSPPFFGAPKPLIM